MQGKKFMIVLSLLVVPLLFLVVGILTLRDYGINWDEPYHFMRGQAYFNFLTTRNRDYSNLPKYPEITAKGPIYEDALNSLYRQKGFSVWRSSYQNDNYDFNYMIANESGHPPLNDVLSALTNYVFYQRLHILGDIESYHLFEIVASTLIVVGVGVLTYYHYGLVAGIVASLSLAIYPLFFSESHFNIKDPPEAAFFGLTLIFFYFGIIRNNWKLMVVSAIFAGLALGTKLNIVFIIFIVFPWLVFYVAQNLLPNFSLRKIIKFLRVRKMLILSLILYLPISFGIVYALWPFLWNDTMANVFKILDFYKQIGIGTPGEMTKYLFYKWNTYPIIWIFYTTQVPLLILSVFGAVFSIQQIFIKKQHISLLILLWFSIPILRASWPNTDIYGGVRQVMEYVPAFAVLAGIGAAWLLKTFNSKAFVIIVIALFLSFSAYEMCRIHPNENVYFNQLIGGLPGARLRNIPYWGNSYGNVYLQGVKWLNANAGPNAKVGLPIGYPNNLPPTKLRTDINLSNSYWSGTNREGEYEIELDFEWPIKYWYSFQYYDKYLNPVFVAQVDGVPLLKVWKNDIEHTKTAFKDEVEYKPSELLVRKNTINNEIFIDMGTEIYLTGIIIDHSNAGCEKQLPAGYVALSKDNRSWVQEADPINTPQVPITATGWTDNKFIFLVPGKSTRYIIIDPQLENSCYLKNAKVTIRGLKVRPPESLL